MLNALLAVAVLLSILCIPSTVHGTKSDSPRRRPMTCFEAQLKCGFRNGCSNALVNYNSACIDVIKGRTKKCSNLCHKALIALTSTDEGQNLMRCNCEQDAFCMMSKRRIEVCRDVVTRAIDDDTVVSCSVAQWICSADTQCGTALTYYHRLCRAMVDGRKCSHRCNNSISILNRQEKAAKLRTCFCDGSEQFDCVSIRQNMDTLCFGLTELKDYRIRGGNAVDINSPRNPDKPTGSFSPASAISWSLPTFLLIHLLVLCSN